MIFRLPHRTDPSGMESGKSLNQKKGGTPRMKAILHILGGKRGEDAKRKLNGGPYILETYVGGEEHYDLIDPGIETSDDDSTSWELPPDFQEIENFPWLDRVWITHAHRDHAAAAAMKIIRKKLKGKFLATRTTYAFMPHVLHHQRAMSENLGERRPYDVLDINWTLKNFTVIAKPEVLEVVPGKIWVLADPCGHIRGANSLTFLVREGKKIIKIMFSGDYAVHNQLSTRGAPLPREGWYPDVIASFDCTNGADPRIPRWEDEAITMADDGLITVKSGHIALYTTFAMDRCLTVARLLADRGLPVAIDGPSAIECTRIACSSEGFWCEGDLPISTQGIGRCERVGDALASEEPLGIVVPSGMLYGPSLVYARELLEREEALVGAAGWAAHGTNMAKVLDTKRGECVDLVGDRGEVIRVRKNANVKQYRPTAHSRVQDGVARIRELLSKSVFLKTAKRPKVGLCHGSTPALDGYEHGLTGFETFRADRERKVVLVD